MSIQTAIQKKPKPERFSVKLGGAFFLGAVVSAIISPIVTYQYALRPGHAAESPRTKAKVIRGARGADRRSLYTRVYSEAYDRLVIRPTMFVQHLKEIVNAQGTTAELVAPAQSFVRVMQQRRAPLMSLSKTLAQETDDLQRALAALERNPDERSLKDGLRKTVLRLSENWHEQCAAVETSLKQSMAELGVERTLKAVDGESD